MLAGLLVFLAVSKTVAARTIILANEAATLATLRQFWTAIQMYRFTNQVYPDPLGVLSEATPPFLDSRLTGGIGANGCRDLAGYRYDYHRENGEQYQLVARPVEEGSTGLRSFLLDETGVLYYTTDGTDPTSDSELIH